MPPSRRPEDLDLAGVCQGVGLAMVIAFLSILLKVLLPPALLQPAWQLQASEALRGAASVPLVGVVFLLLAKRYDPDAQGLAGRVLWARRLAVAAALGFLLLIPLQISAGLRQISQATSGEARQLRTIQQVAAAIQQAGTPEAMNRAIAQLPGLPPDFRGTFSRPIPEVRAALLAQIRPQIGLVETRLRELRGQRIQSALRFFLFDGLTALAYAVAFAAIGRTGEEQPTLLQRCLWLPADLRRRFAAGRPTGRVRGPVNEAWISSLTDDSDPKAGPKS